MAHRLLYLITVFHLMCLLTPPAGWSAAQQKGTGLSETEWSEENADVIKKWNKHKEESFRSWHQFKTNEQKSWQDLKNRVEENWGEFVSSTTKIWVDYNLTADTRSYVDFDKGKITIETSLPIKKLNALEEAKNNIACQTRKIFSKNSLVKENILEKQIKNKNGEILSDDGINKFIQDEILARVETEDLTTKTKDKTIRKKFTVTIYLVPDHIRIRAEKYLPLIQAEARRFNLPLQLVMAIIHTESCFNPLAVSPCGAIGLMQIMPEQAGREAHFFLYKKHRDLTPEFLYQTGDNIKLGTAYLYLLKNRHFVEINDSVKNRYLTICGYNWGPTAVKDKILKFNPLQELGREDVFLLLTMKTPRETAMYLQRVNERMPLYDQFDL